MTEDTKKQTEETIAKLEVAWQKGQAEKEQAILEDLKSPVKVSKLNCEVQSAIDKAIAEVMQGRPITYLTIIRTGDDDTSQQHCGGNVGYALRVIMMSKFIYDVQAYSHYDLIGLHKDICADDKGASDDSTTV